MASQLKELMLKELQGEFRDTPYAFISTFDKASVAELSEFRNKIRGAAKRSIVVKHALAEKVFEGLKYSEAKNFLKGSVVVTFGDRDPQIISKQIVEYAKVNKKFASGGVIFEEKVMDSAFVERLATLPSREELLTQLVVRVQSPISGFVMGLNQVLRGFVQVVNEIKKQREAESGAA
jgi:large subunit ribosomal protein L10